MFKCLLTTDHALILFSHTFRHLYTHTYLHFHSCFSLGSTRFLKVARAKSQEGLVVVKVFAIHDPTLPLLTYKQTIDNIR
jgi:hypothetical protein